jgi:hypothetical protein
MTAEQLNTTNKIVNAQLAQAQAGKPPLNLSAYGLPTTGALSLTSGSGLVLLLGGGILLVALMMGAKK